jgi:glycosyltransferase involved in cell wall biosynthesis
MSANHQVQVISLWDTNRHDWLLGTTLRAPSEILDYVHEGIPVHRLGFTPAKKWAMLPFILPYYGLMDLCLPPLVNIQLPYIQPYAAKAQLIHHVRIGREPLGFASLKAARQNDIPLVLTPLHHPRWGTWLHHCYHQLYRQADAVIALTHGEKEILTTLGVNPERIHVIGMGPVLPDHADGLAFRRLYHLSDRPIILFMGQKYAYKGVDILLQSMKRVWESYPEACFVFIGPRTSYSLKLFADYSDPRVIEIDTVDQQTKANALSACTLLCLPSSQESFGGVFTEAWSYARPVIGCNIPAVREIIQDGQNGFLVSPNPSEISERINTLLDHPEMADQMGRTGYGLVSSKFTWPKIAEQTEKVYKNVLK